MTKPEKSQLIKEIDNCPYRIVYEEKGVMINIRRLKTITYVDFSAMYNVSFFSPIQIYLESSVVEFCF